MINLWMFSSQICRFKMLIIGESKLLMTNKDLLRGKKKKKDLKTFILRNSGIKPEPHSLIDFTSQPHQERRSYYTWIITPKDPAVISTRKTSPTQRTAKFSTGDHKHLTPCTGYRMGEDQPVIHATEKENLLLPAPFCHVRPKRWTWEGWNPLLLQLPPAGSCHRHDLKT